MIRWGWWSDGFGWQSEDTFLVTIAVSVVLLLLLASCVLPPSAAPDCDMINLWTCRVWP